VRKLSSSLFNAGFVNLLKTTGAWRVLVVALDACIISVSAIVALFLRDNLVLEADKLQRLLPYVAVSAAAACLIVPATGLHRRVWRFTTIGDTRQILLCCIFSVISATLIMFSVTRLEGIARSIPILQILIAFVGMAGARVLTRLWYVDSSVVRPFTTARERPQNVLLVGLNSLTHLYVRAVQEFGSGRVLICGIVDPERGHRGLTVGGYPVLSPETSLSAHLERLSVHGAEIDKVVLAVPSSDLPPALSHQLDLLTRSARVPIVSIDDVFGDFGREQEDRRTQGHDSLCGTGQLFTINSQAIKSIARQPFWRIKRAIDAVLALVMLLILAPVLAMVAFLVWLDGGRPLVFWQLRPGVAGRPIKLMKFRTMSNADAAGAINLSPNERDIADLKRSSRLGRFLRVTRLDELPQLWNILRGEMSFIGPRPLLAIDQSTKHAARLLVRPGLTGWAQVKGGRSISAADKAALDVWYFLNASLTLDLKILLATVRMVLFGETIDRAAIDQAWSELRRRGIYRPVDTPPAVSTTSVSPPRLPGDRAA
jgi:lipopolysaccharide/colanic/teichoic acid biosynthesis glycosyltransferase